MIKIKRIHIRQDVEVENAAAVENIRKLLADILKIEAEKIEMVYTDTTYKMLPKVNIKQSTFSNNGER